MLKLVRTALLFMAGFAAALGATVERAYAKKNDGIPVFISNKTVSDSLVENLKCSHLSVDSIYKSIKADAFKPERNMPITNWGFRSGLVYIAGCWGLSSTQRMMLYLGRYNEASSMRADQLVPRILDQVRRGSLERLIDDVYNDRNHGDDRIITRSLKSYSVFPVEGDSLAENAWHGSSLWRNLMEGYKQNVDGKIVHRHFRAEIERNQADHFFRVRNVGMGAGDGPRSVEDNRETAALMKYNASRKRLTLINLRAGRTAQHIVMVKSYKTTHGITTFTVYDSNAPQKDWEVKYSEERGVFYAPEIISRFTQGAEYRDLGVYVVDEKEREDFEYAMMAYYRIKCR